MLGEVEGIETLSFLKEDEIENRTGEEWLTKLSSHLKSCGEVEEGWREGLGG